MKKHTKVYMRFFKYDISDWIECEIPGCRCRAIDIHHIDSRKMGGSKDKDVIENLMAMCREHHIEYGDKVQYKDFLNEAHNARIQNHIRK